MLATVRLVAPNLQIPPTATQSLVARACGMADWGALLAALDETRHRVSATWRGIVDQTTENDDGE
jgi:[glutamine synthetase] adenylyltransferase / [glutamine synthetase]-adenylyl-L-tyrosine phosphorylase